MSKFRVTDTFSLESRRLFVLVGSIVEGEIQAGMIVRVPLNSSLSLSGSIHSIEFARRAGGWEDVCLCIAYDDPSELATWRAMNIGGETIEILSGDQD